MKLEVGGQIQGISLDSFLQIVQMDKTSCTLKVYANDDLGYLWMIDGKLVAAEAGSLHGLNAAYEIICWHHTVIILDNTPAPEQNISTPLISILMEGLRRRDERSAMERAKDIEGAEEDKTDAPLPDEKTFTPPKTAVTGAFEEIPSLSMEEEETPLLPPPLPSLPPRPLHPAVALDLEDEAQSPLDDDDSWIYEYEDEDIQEEPNPIRTILITCLLFFAIAGTSFSGYIWYRAHTLESEFQTLITDLTAMARFKGQKDLLETYLDGHVLNRFTHPVTQHLNEANALLEIDQHIHAMPKNSGFIDTSLGLFKRHLKSHPGTPFMTAIRATMKRLPAQLDALDYQHLREAKGKTIRIRLDIYRAYLGDHPQGKYIREVKNLMVSIGDEFYMTLKAELSSCDTEKRWAPCIALADIFTTEFQEDNRFNEIWILRDEMIDREQLEEMRRQTSGLSYEERRTMYHTYLQENPQSTAGIEIRREIAALDEKVEQEKRWQTVKAMSDNPKEAMNVRIREVNLYVERYPDDAFTPEALKKRDELEGLRTRLLKDKKALRENQWARNAEKKRLERQRQALETQRRVEANAKRAQERSAQMRIRELRIKALLSKATVRFRSHDDGTLSDTQSGLTWMILDSKNRGDACMNFKEGKRWVETLSIGERSDWRLPTSNELALLYNGTPHYPASGAPWYWTSELESGPWGTNASALTFDPTNKTTFIQKARPLNECGYIHAVHAP